jgi:hypothetical protein
LGTLAFPPGGRTVWRAAWRVVPCTSSVPSLTNSEIARIGAQPILRAATGPGVRSGECYGSGGWGEFTGKPVLVDMSEAARNADDAGRLWDISLRLTGVVWPRNAGMLTDGP